MKILMVNTSDKGGAANSCLRLHKGLIIRNIESKILLKYKFKNHFNTFAFYTKRTKSILLQKLLNKLKRKLFKLTSDTEKFLVSRNPQLEMFSFPSSDTNIINTNLYREADIINLHWVANFVDFETFFEKNTKPVIWTLHDMNAFTGGEHYQEEYMGIDNSGHPKRRQVGEYEKRVSAKNLSLKMEALKNIKNLTIVAPSLWLVNEAKKSKLFQNREVLHIPYGIDKKNFAPRDKSFARDLLGIPKDKKVILFVAESINNSRKGFIYLREAFKKLSIPDVTLCAIGSTNGELTQEVDNLIDLGSIDDERLMSVAYSSADVFVIPSLMDNLPNTVLESLMCGTPVIGFPVGGITDMIKSGINGYLAEDISVDSLLDTLVDFLHGKDTFDRDLIRENAVLEYDLDIQASKYESLFKEKLNY